MSKTKNKRLTALLFSSVLLLSFSGVSVAKTASEDDYETIKKNKWSQEKESVELNSSTGVFIHNDGEPIENDVLEEGTEDGMELFGVYKETVDGKDQETYYFANTNEVDVEKIKKSAKEKKKKMLNKKKRTSQESQWQ